MNGDQKGTPPIEPDRPHDPNDVYGGRWSPGETPPDRSGRGSAPRPPGAPAPKKTERKSFKTESGEGAEIAADDAGASARTETPQGKDPKTP